MKPDPYLEKRLERYDRWMGEGKIDFSSRVVPVAESLEAVQWVLPFEQALEIVRQAASVVVKDCECRTRYRRCDHPVEVCLLLNRAADRLIEKGEACRASLPEAGAALKKANESGLVHLTLYQPDHEVYALCSCCPCCCHDLQLVQQYGRSDLIRRSAYVPETDTDACVSCGLCVDRCVFSARKIADSGLEFQADDCLGCGLCVTACPEEAISMTLRE